MIFLSFIKMFRPNKGDGGIIFYYGNKTTIKYWYAYVKSTPIKSKAILTKMCALFIFLDFKGYMCIGD